jgi:hypothetical protein
VEKHKARIVHLDVNDGKVRDKLRAVSNNEHLRQLFEDAKGR